MVLVLSVGTVITFAMTVRSLLIVLGAYKDPLLASFEQYGEERVFSPPLTLFLWTLAFIYISLYWYVNPALVFAVGLAIVLPVGGFHDLFYRILHKHKDRLRQFPRWSNELLQMTDRDERRRIAYMWLRLPPSTRMIYNANNYLFMQWVEQVLLTVAQS